MTAIAKTKKTGGRAGRRASPGRYAVSDGTLLLNLEAEGKWYIVTSPLDPELVTQARTIGEAFRMAYDAQALLEEYRSEMAEKANAQ